MLRFTNFPLIYFLDTIILIILTRSRSSSSSGEPELFSPRPAPDYGQRTQIVRSPATHLMIIIIVMLMMMILMLIMIIVVLMMRITVVLLLLTMMMLICDRGDILVRDDIKVIDMTMITSDDDDDNDDYIDDFHLKAQV